MLLILLLELEKQSVFDLPNCGSLTTQNALFVIDTSDSYNVLIGRDWIHPNACILRQYTNYSYYEVTYNCV